MASEREEKRRRKEERHTEIMVDFEADKITGDDARKRLEELDDEFRLLKSGPEESANDKEEVVSDDNI